MTTAFAPPRSLVKAAHRLNPAIDLEVDVVAVISAAGASTKDDWTTGSTKNNVTIDDNGAVRLTESGSTVVFQSGGAVTDATTKYGWFFSNNRNQNETLWLDFWPDPALIGPNGFTLSSLDIKLGRKNGNFVFGNLFGFNAPGNGNFIVQVARLDANWNRELLGDQLLIPCTDVAMDGGLISLDFRARGRTIRIQTGRMRTRTASGLDANGIERTADVNFEGTKKVSHLQVPMGFSIGISIVGVGPQGAWLGMLPVATFPVFDTTTFWRAGGTSRNCGPFSPDADGFSPLDAGHNPGYGLLSTGAVPSYGAKNTAAVNGGGTPYGQWGVSRQSSTYDLPQTQEQPGWQQPYHVVRGVTYTAAGSIVQVFDLGSIPTAEVHFRADAAEPTGTSVTYSVRGRNTTGDVWTALGAQIDGAVFSGAQLFRYYELTATLDASPDGLVTPVLQSAFFTARNRFATYRYTDDIDSTASIDPTTAQSEIGELKLPMLRAGLRDGRDLATFLATEFAPANVEAWVYVKETTSPLGTRHFVNLYRLEDRDPDIAQEAFTFVSGMDRLKVVIPQNQETFVYPVDGNDGVINTVAFNATTRECTIGVATVGAFAGIDITSMRYEGLTGALAGTNWLITAKPADNQLVIVLEDAVQTPAVGDTFRIHSDQTQRLEVTYSGQDYAAVYADILANQAAVPQRYHGALPPTTGRTTTGRLTADGRAALDPLQEIALHCGGAPAWVKGRIAYVDLYGEKDVVARWNERDYSDLQTPTGYGRRMPSITVKYGYDWTAQKFAFEVTYDDKDALLGLGRANLFDAAVLPDELCQWNDFAEAQHLTSKMLAAWSTGVRLWKVTTVMPWPWIEMGDAVAISTDQYTDRRIVYADDGVTDIGTPIKRRVTAVGVVVGKNLWGTDWTVAVRGLSAISQSTQRSGGVGVTIALPPTVVASFDAEGHVVITSSGLANVIGHQLGVGSTPEAATDAANAAAEIAGQSVTATDTQVFDPGETAYVAAIAHAAAGVSAPTVIAVVREGSAAVLPTVVADTSETATTGTITLEVTDPQTRITLIESRSRVGNGAWGAWAALAEPYTATVDLVDKQPSAIEWRVTGADAFGVVRVLTGGAMTFAIGARPLKPTIRPTVLATGQLDAALEGDSDTTGFRVAVALGDADVTIDDVRAAALVPTLTRQAIVSALATLTAQGQRYTIAACAYNAGGQESDVATITGSWLGTGTTGNTDITIDVAHIARTQTDVTIPYALGATTTRVDVYALEYVSDPGTPSDVQFTGARVKNTPLFPGGSGLLTVPVSAPGHFLVVAFVPTDAFGQAQPVTIVTQALKPSSPPPSGPMNIIGAPSIVVAPANGTVTIGVPIPVGADVGDAGHSAATQLRAYKDGAPYQTFPLLAGDAGTTKNVQHTNLAAGTSSVFTYVLADATGAVSATASPGVTVTMPGGQQAPTQLTAPTVSSGEYDAASQSYVVTILPSGSPPAGTTYRVEESRDGGAFSYFRTGAQGGNTISITQTNLSQTSLVRVRAECSGYTPSDYVEGTAVTIPPAGGSET